MKLKLSINAKMLVFILSSTVLVFILSVGYISVKTRQLALKDAEEIASKIAQTSALEIEKELSVDIAVLRTLAQAFSVYDEMEEQEWKDLFLKMYYKVYSENKSFYKLWDSWELKYFDPAWDKDYGRYAITLYRQNNQILNSKSIRSVDGDNELYSKIKSVNKDMIWEPYWDAFVEETEVKKFMTSLSSPIYRNKKFAGIVAADIIMDRFQDIIDQISRDNSTEAFLTSNEGILVGHPNEKLIGQSVNTVYPEYDDQFSLSTQIKEGKTGVYRGLDKNKNRVLIVNAPIQVGEYETPWAITLMVPYKTILREANRAQLVSILVSLLGLILLSIVIFMISRKMSEALVDTTHVLEKLSVGDVDNIKDLVVNRGDEIEDIANSLNELKNGLIKTSEFALHIGRGDLDATFSPLSDKDVLGNSLLEMRESLRNAKAEEVKRKLEDEKMNWTTQGLAKFGEILRTNSNNIKDLSFSIMSNLINYLEINQGALFIVDDTQEGEVVLEMKSAIAYGRDKYLKKQIRVGEELVGRCAFERKTIYITDLPKDYIKITSGMGTSNPQALLLVPLVLNDEIFGVIELASFHEIEKHQLEFVERLGESIASTIATVKVNEKTSRLLDQSKTQSEELAAQEEEMRQNLEELQATQEESARRDYEMSGVIKALGTTAFTVEYNLDGKILSCNEKYAEMLGVPTEKIVGQNHQDGYEFTAEKKANYNLFWGELVRGISKKEVNQLKFNGKEFWVEEIYTPIMDLNENTPYKILKIGFDITAQKLKELKMQEQEIRIKKERLLLGEYQGRITEMQDKLKQAESKINELENKAPVVQDVKEIQKDEVLIDDADDFVWTSKMILGIDEMDEQHKQLVNLINLVYDSYVQDKNKKEIKENIRSFVDFASYHFGNEEQYFEQFGYEDAATHTADHQDYLKNIKQFQKDYNSNSLKQIDKEIKSIKNWLFNHILNADTKYTDLFKSKGL